MYLILISGIIIYIIIAIITCPTPPITLNNYKPQARRVVCSLTTRPTQPYYFKDVLTRLVEQFDAVYLAVPKISFKGIPYPEISHPGVTIIPVEEDYGPITKFFGAINSTEDPNTLVVVLDDDVLYDTNLRKIYENVHTKYPNSILSGAGTVYKYKQLGLSWLLTLTGRRENYPSIMPSFLGTKNLTTVCGYAGITFKKNLIQKEEFIQFIKYWNKYKDCFCNDDIVVSAYFASKNIPRLWLRIPRCKSPSDKDTESLSANGREVMFRQNSAFQIMRDCFNNDSYRFDCLCMLDIIIIIILITIIKYLKGI